MSNHGWVRIYRQIEENPLWTSEPFSRGQAWIDLVIFANHIDGFFYVRGNKVNVKRGQIGWSEVTMAKRWHWSRNKVRGFLKVLENEQQIEQQKSTITSVITIINYDKFQTKKTADGTAERQQKDSRRNTNKNIKNVKNVKNNKEDNTKVLSRKKTYGNENIDYILKIFRRDIGQPPVDKYPRRVAWAFVQNIQFSYKKKTGKDVTDEKFQSIADWLFGKYTEKDFAENTYKLETVRLHSKAFLEKALEGGGKNG